MKHEFWFLRIDDDWGFIKKDGYLPYGEIDA